MYSLTDCMQLVCLKICDEMETIQLNLEKIVKEQFPKIWLVKPNIIFSEE